MFPFLFGKTFTADAMRPLPSFLLLCASYGGTAIEYGRWRLRLSGWANASAEKVEQDPEDLAPRSVPMGLLGWQSRIWALCDASTCKLRNDSTAGPQNGGATGLSETGLPLPEAPHASPTSTLRPRPQSRMGNGWSRGPLLYMAHTKQLNAKGLGKG